MALPVLLRGLSPTNSWARLKFAELSERERKTTQLQDPQVKKLPTLIRNLKLGAKGKNEA